MKYIVISGDMENSRGSLFEGGADKVILSRLKSLNEKFKGVLVYPAAVFKGDELQCVISAYNLKYICKIITELYYCFFPYRLHIGIGAGALLWGIIAQFFGYPSIFLSAAVCGILGIIAYFSVLTGPMKKSGIIK
jgi:hypothetical protein